MSYQRQVLLSTDPVPRRSVVVLAVVAHCALIALIAALARQPKARVVLPQYVVQNISVPTRVAFTPAPARAGRAFSASSHARKKPAPMAAIPEVGATEGTASATLLEHAREATAGIVVGLKQRQFFGFDPNNYQIPFHISGDFPIIAADEVPPRFEQIVIVELTIDIDGTVAQAKIVAGSVDPKIQHKLLAAALGFKYSPAKRGSTPIPSQLDLPVHVPS